MVGSDLHSYVSSNINIGDIISLSMIVLNMFPPNVYSTHCAFTWDQIVRCPMSQRATLTNWRCISTILRPWNVLPTNPTRQAFTANVWQFFYFFNFNFQKINFEEKNLTEKQIMEADSDNSATISFCWRVKRFLRKF